MPKAYWIARLNIRDPDAYGEYRKRHTVIFAKYGAKFLARGPAAEAVMGEPRGHNVILEFESLEQALACYHSPEYQEARVFLTKAGDVDLVIVPAYTGSQPGR